MKISLLLASLLVTVSALSFGQAAEGKGGNPTGLSSVGVSIDFASSDDYARHKSMIYYKISYKGNTFKEVGSQLIPATIGGAWAIPKVASDTDEFKLDLINGVGKIDSPMFDTLALKPISFLAPFGDLRGAIQVAGRVSNSGELNIGFGLETKPYTPLRNRTLDLTNQFRVGIMGIKHSEAASAQKDFLAFTYRTYVGTGFNYVRSYKMDDLVNDIVKRFTKLSPADQDTLIKTGDSKDPLVQSLALTTAADRKNPDVVREALKTYYDARIDQPSISIEAAAEGTYAPNNFVNRRYNSLWNASLYWWPSPKNPDSGKFFITYQNGYARADLNNSITGLIAGFSIKF